MGSDHSISVFFAISAAFVFAVSIPYSRCMLGGVTPLMLAGLLYLGAGAGMAGVLGAAAAARRPFLGPAISRGDLPWLAGSVIIGSVIGPVLLLWSLERTTGTTASMLLSFEAVAAALIACLVFGELIGRRVWAALGCITAACLALSYAPGSETGISPGALGVLAVAVLWGFAASINRRLSRCEPGRVVVVKCLAAGLAMLGAATFAGEALPATGIVLAVLCIGFVAYGLSNLFLLRALRGLGAARTSSIYGIYPLLGFLLSVTLLGEVPDPVAFAALPAMAAGVVLIITESGTGTPAPRPVRFPRLPALPRALLLLHLPGFSHGCAAAGDPPSQGEDGTVV
ncbi:MAG: DMT family transporter [Methanomicrobiaceae archaeon]|nr:DMT family transporter [Methanomicrobiaceae archaeon]